MHLFPKKIGSRGYLFQFDHSNSPFDYPTFSYVITALNNTYICDTHLGTKSMQPILDFLSQNEISKPIVLFNSHFHWDHIWGNCAFPNSDIVAHTKCLEILSDEAIWESMISRQRSMINGTMIKKLPNKTFEKEMFYDNDGILFFYTPGHTIDSASCLDKIDQVLFVGDNVETPVPSIEWHHLDRYIHTLNNYLELQINYLITSHQGLVKQASIIETLHYIKGFQNNTKLNFKSENEINLHMMNQKQFLASQYEELGKIKYKAQFPMNDYLKILDEGMTLPLSEFKQLIKQFIVGD